MIRVHSERWADDERFGIRIGVERRERRYNRLKSAPNRRPVNDTADRDVCFGKLRAKILC
jgi:hypothetical protein